MAKREVDYTQHYDLVVNALTSTGLLLGSYDERDKPNVMTIGWGTLGVVWSLPMWIVLVRPSRYTFRCIEKSAAFTVNVPSPEMKEALLYCGSKSGRDVDKFAECKLTHEKAATVHAPVVAQCPIVYECSVVHSNDVIPTRLERSVLAAAYPGGDYHRIFFGKILAARADADAAGLLRR